MVGDGELEPSSKTRRRPLGQLTFGRKLVKERPYEVQ